MSLKTKNTDVQSFVKEYTSEEDSKAIEKLTMARINLLIKHPFFGNMATRLRLVEASTWCKTIATDGRMFYYNVGFVNSLNPKEAMFGFCHEVLHNVFDHHDRRDFRDHRLANIAADYAVNQILKDDNIGEIPSVINIYQDDKFRDWSFEQIYFELEKNATKIDLETLGQLLDDHLDSEDEGGGEGGGDENGNCGSEKGRPRLSPEEKQAIRDEIKEAMLSAAASCKSLPESIKRLIKNFTEPKMDWRQLLRQSIKSTLKSNFSFSKPNRKSQQSGAILPGLLNQETIDIAVAIDTSGSISQAQIDEFLSEIKGIMDEFVEFKLHIWCFDTSVHNPQQYTMDNSDEIRQYEPGGGGGTDFEANFNFMKENDIAPKMFVMFTDGMPYGSWGDESYCDTLFIIHNTYTQSKIIPPFGEYAYYKDAS